MFTPGQESDLHTRHTPQAWPQQQFQDLVSSLRTQPIKASSYEELWQRPPLSLWEELLIKHVYDGGKSQA